MQSQPDSCLIRQLGVQPYQSVLEAMHAFVADRKPDTDDELWLLQHEPVFTQGQAGKPEHILDAHAIPVVQSDRGGQVTYHAPGQLIVYFLLDIKRRKFGVRTLVDIIEQAVITLLAKYEIQGELKRGAPGVYVGDKKIAALGLRIKRGCSLHGLSLNIDMDLTPFSYINPCGYSGLQVTNLKPLLNKPVDSLFTAVQEQLTDILLSELENYKAA